MKSMVFCVAGVIFLMSSANAAKPVAADIKRAETAIQAENRVGDSTVVDTGPAMPSPPPSRCGDMVYQWVPGESGSIDLESLNQTNMMLALALEAANLPGVENTGSIEADLFAKATIIAELLERLCVSDACNEQE